MRVFVGLPAPPEFARKIEKIHQSQYPMLRLSRLEFHITLKAPQEVQNLDEWVKAAFAACINFSAPKITIEKVFINPFNLCLEVRKQPLVDLQDSLVRALKPYNSPGITLHEKETFIPHITIGRSNKPIPPRERKELLQQLNINFDELSFTASTVRLYAMLNGVSYDSAKDINLTA
jgi:2'-5' RNA ligase